MSYGHKVHQTKAGLHVVSKRRKFRPDPNGLSLAQKGDEVYVQEITGNRLDAVRVTKYTWGKSTQDYNETWTTTEKAPQIRERLKDGQVNINLGKSTRAQVVVGHDGFNFGKFRREPTNQYGQTKSAGYNVLIVDQIMFTWDEWDDLIAKVAEARDLVEIGPIATKLEEEVQAHDDLEKYLRDKGLVTDAAAELAE